MLDLQRYPLNIERFIQFNFKNTQSVLLFKDIIFFMEFELNRFINPTVLCHHLGNYVFFCYF